MFVAFKFPIIKLRFYCRSVCIWSTSILSRAFSFLLVKIWTISAIHASVIWQVWSSACKENLDNVRTFELVFIQYLSTKRLACELQGYIYCPAL